MAIPENLVGEDVKNALCHESIGYRVAGSHENNWMVTRGGSIPYPLPKQDWPLRPSYIALILSDLNVSEAQFLNALKATSPQRPATPPPPAPLQ